jgi:hypothetical protein
MNEDAMELEAQMATRPQKGAKMKKLPLQIKVC